MSIARAEILIRTRRFDDAEEALHASLRGNPDDPRAHLLLAQVHLARKNTQAARREAGEAIRLDPDDAVPFLMLAAVEQAEDREDAAAAAALEARRRAPTWAEPLNVLARREAVRERWPAALAHAEDALALDPENADAGALRALSLTHLGRADEAADAADRGLRLDPHDPQAHAVRGWTLLHRGEAREAEAAFLEALRLEPGHAQAAAGLVAALKRRSWVLRPVFAFFLWMQRIPPRLRGGLILGAWLLAQVLSSLSRQYPALSPWVLPIVFAYGGFCVLTWTADPLMNLALRLHPKGRHALSPSDRLAGTLFAAACGAALLAAVGALGPLAGASSLGFAALAFFLAGLFGSNGVGQPPSKTRAVTLVAAGVLAVAGLGLAIGGLLEAFRVAGLFLLIAAPAALVGFLAPLARNLFR